MVPGDGGWGEWSSWTDCTKSCGGGVQTRRRQCDSPVPEGEGSYCEGLGTEVIGCNTNHCPGTFPVWRMIVFWLGMERYGPFCSFAVTKEAFWFPDARTNEKNEK